MDLARTSKVPRGPEPLLLVSNRLPVTVRQEHGETTVTPSAGGLATGLRRLHEQSPHSLWIGWPGDISRLGAEERVVVDSRLRELRTVPLYLSASEVSRFYEGFCNGVLWPLFHYHLERVPMSARDWEVYRAVNERFADLVCEHYRPGHRIWVHDYQLLLLPGLLRKRIPDANIGFFLHIPFPSSEVFRILPWREVLLEGMLGADLIGFHTLDYMRHFANCVLRLMMGAEIEVDSLWFGGRHIQLGAFPIGVDATALRALSEQIDPELIHHERAGGEQILLGIDRLDYTKGIPRRLLAIERLLEREPSLRGRVRLVQVAVPSRTKVEAYAEFRRQVDEQVGRINGLYGTTSSVPIHYLFRSFSERQVVTMYRAADVMLVTPIRDGMNLVAKEFVASRIDEDGVLILSEFTGAAADLAEALLVNPYDIDTVASTIKRALTMPEVERKARMRALQKRVMSSDIHWWSNSFLESLERAVAEENEGVRGLSSNVSIDELAERLRGEAQLVLVFDYDGTLVPFADEPNQAVPDAELLSLLRQLALRSGTSVHIVSGRSKSNMDQWFGELPAKLYAESGWCVRERTGIAWVIKGEPPMDWKDKVRPLMQRFCKRTPGSFVEEKMTSLSWHYRRIAAEFGAMQAKELRIHLNVILSNLPVQVIMGSKVVEVRVLGSNKASVLRMIAEQEPMQTRVVSVGDQRSDEDLSALPEKSIAIQVGSMRSKAPYRLENAEAVRRFIQSLVR